MVQKLQGLSAFPSSDSPSLVLLPATPAEQLTCFEINWPSWGGRLTEAQYLEREKYLASQGLTGNGKLTHWILTNPRHTNQDDEHDILAACETYQKVAYVAKRGHVKEIICHGIASVFCRNAYRGRGYAQRMIQELGRKLDSLQPKQEDRLSLLWSDIGKKFYNQLGWKPMPSSHIQLPPVDRTTYAAIKARLGLPAVQDVLRTNLDDLICKPECERVKMILGRDSAAEEAKDKTLICIRPDIEHMTWHHAREEFIADALLGKKPDIKGAISASHDLDKLTQPAAVWTRVFGSTVDENCLHILHLAIPPYTAAGRSKVINALASLLLQAQLEARTWDMRQGVQLWNPDEVIIETAKLLAGQEGDVALTFREEESIASLRYEGVDLNQVEWRFNEKYAWC